MNRIKDLRKERGLRQEDLAAMLHTSASAVSNYEIGYRNPDLETIQTLCDIFECSADYLLGRSDQRHQSITTEEAAIIAAYRQADEDTKAMIALALKRWMRNPKAKDAAS